MVVVETIPGSRRFVAMLAVIAIHFDFQLGISRFIKTNMLVKNIIGPPQLFGPRHIGFVFHPDHETFRVGMGRIGVTFDASVKRFLQGVEPVKPVGRHGQGVPCEETPECVLDSLTAGNGGLGDCWVHSYRLAQSSSPATAKPIAGP